jgi:hypothetical protein
VKIPTVIDYSEVYDELVVHSEFYPDQRVSVSALVAKKVLAFAEAFQEFLSSCFKGSTLDYYQLLQLIARDNGDTLDPYHSEDIRRICEEVYIACEDGLKFPNFHQTPYRDRIRQRLRESLDYMDSDYFRDDD